MPSDYWNNYWRGRTSRRRFLGAGAAAGAGAAGIALVGCGDDDDAPANGAPADDDSAPANGDDTAAGDDERYGGILRFPYVGVSSGDPPTLFPFENLTYLAQVQASMHYSRLVTEYAGPDVEPEDYTALEGDLAESMPEQPDDQTYIFKLRENIHFHDKEPMNGRQATAEDFVDTYRAFLSMSQNAATYEDIIENVEATDEFTVQFTLSQPFAPFLAIHASTTEGLWFIPVESIDGGQAQESPVGTGPWVFDSWESGVSLNWNRNPNYFIPELPYFDRAEASLINDPQRILAGLRAGDLDMSGLTAPLYDEAQEQLDQDGYEHFSGHTNVTSFWFNFDNDGGRWQDRRLRQALSMSLNRESILDTLDPTGQGDYQSPFCAPVLAPFFLSPRNDDYGDSAQFFEFNPQEARQLFEAATGEETPFIRINANVDAYGRLREQKWELTAASLQEAGWDVELNYQEYGTYIQTTFLGEIDEGVALGPLIGAPRDPHDILSRNISSRSARRNWGGEPPEEMDRIEEMIDEQVTMLDLDERLEYIHEMQRELAEYMVTVPHVGPSGFTYVNPWMQNYHHKSGFAFPFTSLSRAYFTPERIAEDA